MAVFALHFLSCCCFCLLTSPLKNEYHTFSTLKKNIYDQRCHIMAILIIYLHICSWNFCS
jgi:hypothetical protein